MAALIFLLEPGCLPVLVGNSGSDILVVQAAQDGHGECLTGDRRITRLDCGRGALMLDNPEKTARLLAALKAAVPFKVELVPSLVTYLRAQHVAIADQTQHIVSNLSYAGDEGGIVCHIAPPDKEEALVVSLTQVRVPRSMPLAAAVADYHNHRVKKLKKQRMA
jgi:hypothetical protein